MQSCCNFVFLGPPLRMFSPVCADQIAGGHPFKPPRQDLNAPDLYIPLMALCTYCILGSIAMISRGRWTTDSMYALVSLQKT